MKETRFMIKVEYNREGRLDCYVAPFNLERKFDWEVVFYDIDSIEGLKNEIAKHYYPHNFEWLDMIQENKIRVFDTDGNKIICFA